MMLVQNSVNKNDYLGEYTGELISHTEADKRGKIYDRANSSFLFDLNDQASGSHISHSALKFPSVNKAALFFNLRLLQSS